MQRSATIQVANVENARKELVQAAAERDEPVSKRQAVEKLAEEIRAAQRKGCPNEEIRKILERNGIVISDASLKGYLSHTTALVAESSKGRRRRAERPPGRPAAGAAPPGGRGVEARAEPARTPVPTSSEEPKDATRIAPGAEPVPAGDLAGERSGASEAQASLPKGLPSDRARARSGAASGASGEVTGSSADKGKTNEAKEPVAGRDDGEDYQDV